MAYKFFTIKCPHCDENGFRHDNKLECLECFAGYLFEKNDGYFAERDLEDELQKEYDSFWQYNREPFR